MNENYYQFALRLLDELTMDELEVKLAEYGFNPRRKFPLFASEEIYEAGMRADQVSIQRFDIPQTPIVELWAANDNSYALAA